MQMQWRASLFWAIWWVSIVCMVREARGQTKLTDWPEGTVILANGDSVSGNVFVNLESELVEVQKENTLNTFSPLQIVMVRLYDPPRIFICQQASLHGHIPMPALFEVVLPGAFATLLMRASIGQNNAAIRDVYGQVIGTFYGNKKFKYTFYLADAEGKIRKVPHRTSSLARFLEKEPTPALLDYIKRHQPSTSSWQDMAGLIAFYNHLKAESAEGK
jgi:hypothetical protein